MKTHTIPQVRYVGGRTREEAAEEFNAAMYELAPLSPRYERDGGGFYIYFDITTSEVETVADEHELKGECHTCEECRHCIRELNRYGYIDARKKRATCAATGQTIRIGRPVCDRFYEGE